MASVRNSQARRPEVMSKRFVDSEIWKKSWYRKLSPKMKCVWHYMTENCDIAGILEFDAELMSFQIGEEIGKNEVVESFENKIIFIEKDKIFIPSFIEFQQNCPIIGLNLSNNCHKGIINKLNKHEKTRGYLGANQVLIRTPGNSNSNSKGNSKKRGCGGKTIFDLWNTSENFTKAAKFTDKRKKAADSRWEENPDEDYWKSVLLRIESSGFCNGKNGRGWKADFDFFIRPDTHVRALEGKYDDQEIEPQQDDRFERARKRMEAKNEQSV